MKIICIVPYQFEGYYNAEYIIPVEYKSPELLRENIIRAHEQYLDEQSAWMDWRYGEYQDLEAEILNDDYHELVEDQRKKQKILNNLRNSVRKENRGAEWKADVTNTEAELNAMELQLGTYRSRVFAIPAPCQRPDSTFFKTGSLNISGDSDLEDMDNYKFIPLDEWLKQHKVI
jgi:hypothetical protein